MHLFTDSLHKIAYATDASVYREIPYGVAYPETEDDVRELMQMAREKGVDLIPRAGGTSLAGQVVGSGIVVDISKHWNRILEINAEERWARVQPGVVRDELNIALKPYGLFFSPETSTSNRCCIGGMFGNNSCGTHSLVYGSTRHHVIAAKGLLADGSVEEFKNYRIEELEERFGERFWENVGEGHDASVGAGPVPARANHESLIEKIYAQLIRFALDEKTTRLIAEHYPDKELQRRSCGYAIDEVIESLIPNPSPKGEGSINLCKLLAGSEGTLAFITEITVSLDVLPPKEIMVVCGHCDALEKSFEGNLVALKHQPTAIELMDGDILQLSKGNVEQQKNRFFVEGDPAALLITELRAETREELDSMADALEQDLLNSGLIYRCTRVYGADVAKVWNLRKAGLGILGGMKGDAKPMGVIEDTAVAPSRLPAYMKDFRQLLDRLGAKCVFYGHISTGELHLRPIINLKTKEGRALFRTLAHETALLVKKHRGSISGEHGDGRLRGEFIPLLYGDEAYELMRQVKRCWDPDGLLNRHKIVDTLPMDSMLRFEEDQQYAVEKIIGTDKTYFNWKAAFDECDAPGATGAKSQTHALMCTIEQCNGAGDCRKSNLIGGTMCPAYKVSRDELKTTRARANVLREVLTRGGDSSLFSLHSSLFTLHSSLFTLHSSLFTFHSSLFTLHFSLIKEVLDSCLACKGCKSECPSNVDMTRLRAELLQHYYDQHGTPLRSWLVARTAQMEAIGQYVRPLYNFMVTWKPTSLLIKKVIGFAEERELPRLQKMKPLTTLISHPRGGAGVGSVLLFLDEFTRHHEPELAEHFIGLLNSLGYQVEIPDLLESGRAAISKGCLKRAKHIAEENVKRLFSLLPPSSSLSLVGLEPSCILSFRDEYPDLVPAELRNDAKELGRHSLLFDEFLLREIKAGRIKRDSFEQASIEIFLHGHCHQKALVGVEVMAEVLRQLLNAKVNVIPSGCCGMAGSFGYEKEHYKTSLAIGEMVLFPEIRKVSQISSLKSQTSTFIVAPGTSCRQQILDGTGVRAVHPIEILYKYLKSNNQ
ncbi:MAG: FAD-binding protein [Prevotella sp.]|nr:FAD-binding protein [Prevotella sp.]